MKVLHADAGREMRGGQWQVLHLHAGLGADSVLLCRAGGPLMQECHRRGVRAEALSIAALASQSRKADITHVHDARSHTWAAAVAGSLLVVSRRVAFPIGRSWLSVWKYARADHYIAVSQHVRSIGLTIVLARTDYTIVLFYSIRHAVMPCILYIERMAQP